MLSLMTATLELQALDPALRNGEEPSYTFIASTGRKDNNGNIYDPTGWDLSDYLRNPVVLLSHQWTELPIGGARRVWIEGDRLMAEIALANTPKAQEVQALLDQGFLRTMSAGSLPLEAEMIRDPKTGWPIGIHSHRQQLVELSIVTIPANSDAIRTAALDQQTAQERQDILQALSTLKESLWTPKP